MQNPNAIGASRPADPTAVTRYGASTRERILHAAFAAFAERGFNGVTIRDLAQRAGVNLAAVNYHFRSKEELYSAVIETALSCWTSQIAVEDAPDDASLEVTLTTIISALAGNVSRRENNLLLPRLIAWDILQRPPESFKSAEASCVTVIQRLMAPHLVGRSDENAALISVWLVSQCLLPATGEQVGSVTPEGLTERITALALFGLTGFLRES